MAVDIPAVREVAERVCAHGDVLDACRRRDIGTLIAALCGEGIMQGQLSVLTGTQQGRALAQPQGDQARPDHVLHRLPETKIGAQRQRNQLRQTNRHAIRPNPLALPQANTTRPGRRS